MSNCAKYFCTVFEDECDSVCGMGVVSVCDCVSKRVRVSLKGNKKEKDEVGCANECN